MTWEKTGAESGPAGRFLRAFFCCNARQRYRILDLERLCWRLGTDRLEGGRKILSTPLEETLAKDQMKREPCWTESMAVEIREVTEDTINEVEPQRSATESHSPDQNARVM